MGDDELQAVDFNRLFAARFSTDVPPTDAAAAVSSAEQRQLAEERRLEAQERQLSVRRAVMRKKQPDPFEVVARWDKVRQRALRQLRRKATQLSAVGVGGSSATDSEWYHGIDGLEILLREASSVSARGACDLGYGARLVEESTARGGVLYNTSFVKSIRELVEEGASIGLPAPQYHALHPLHVLKPAAADLMMWAVMNGELGLARLLWSRADEPMRAAINASRLCRNMSRALGEGHTEAGRLSEHAREYEAWACGTLDILPLSEADEAMRLLTLVPRQPGDEANGAPGMRLWADSVLGVAARGPADDACRGFVAHRHCQATLRRYFAGDSCDSHARLVRLPGERAGSLGHVLALWIEICVRLLHVASCGALRCVLRDVLGSFVDVADGPAMNRFDDVDRADSGRVPRVRLHYSASEREQRRYYDAQAWHDEYYGVVAASSETSTQAAVRVGAALYASRGGEDAGKLRSQHAWRLSVAFFAIPRVKFYLHTAMFVGYLALYIIVVGVVWPRGWLARGSAMQPQWPDELTANFVAELILWVYHFGRLYEEVELLLLPTRAESQGGAELSISQAWSAYFSDVWKVLDAATLGLMSGCFVLRALLWLDSADVSDQGVGAADADYLMARGAIGFEWSTVAILMQIIQSCFAVSAVLVFVRSLGLLGWASDRTGEIVAILIAMVKVRALSSRGTGPDRRPSALLPWPCSPSPPRLAVRIPPRQTSTIITALLVWLLIGFGVGFTGLLPGEALRADVFLQPFWFSFRSLLGDFDIPAVYEALGDSHSPTTGLLSTVTVVLLVLCTYFTTIFIVNLMIALMTSAYEQIRVESTLNRKYRKVALVESYLQRPALPPPFTFFLLLWRLLALALKPLTALASCFRRGRTLAARWGAQARYAGFGDKHIAPAASARLLLKERACRNEYLARPLEPMQDLAANLDDLRNAQTSFAYEQTRGFDYNKSKQRHIERRIAKIEELLKLLVVGKDDPLVPGRPEWASPASLQPLNVMPAYARHKPSKYPNGGAAVESLYAPVCSRSRHQELGEEASSAAAELPLGRGLMTLSEEAGGEYSGALPVHHVHPAAPAYNGAESAPALAEGWRSPPRLAGLHPLDALPNSAAGAGGGQPM